MNREEAMNMIIEGLKFLCVEAMSENTSEPDQPKKAVGTKSPAAKPASVKKPAEKEEAPAADQSYTMSELTAMKYNEFKKLASSLGVDCKGTRDEIMSRVIATGVVSDAANEEAPAAPAKAEKKPATPASKGGKVSKIGAKKQEAAKDEFDEKAEEVAKETPFKDIVDALKEVGIAATKMNYKSQLAKALREGLIDLDEEEGGEEVEGEEAALTSSSYTPDFDLSNANAADNMTDERKEACVQKQSDIIEAVSSDEISSDDIINYLQENATQEELDLLGDDYTDTDLVALYMEVAKHFIDDDGEEHEPGEAYMVNDVPFCCGQPLKYDKRTQKFLCSTCASEYEAE